MTLLYTLTLQLHGSQLLLITLNDKTIGLLHNMNAVHITCPLMVLTQQKYDSTCGCVV